jgi:hypothetical protein
MKITYLVEGVVLHAAGGAKNDPLHLPPATMTKYLTKMCNYKGHEKKMGK